MPAATQASSSLNDVASSAVQPNTLPPNISGGSSMPDRPSWRVSINTSLFFPSYAPEQAVGAFHEVGQVLADRPRIVPLADRHERNALERLQLDLLADLLL